MQRLYDIHLDMDKSEYELFKQAYQEYYGEAIPAGRLEYDFRDYLFNMFDNKYCPPCYMNQFIRRHYKGPGNWCKN